MSGLWVVVGRKALLFCVMSCGITVVRVPAAKLFRTLDGFGVCKLKIPFGLRRDHLCITFEVIFKRIFKSTDGGGHKFDLTFCSQCFPLT